MAIVQRKSGTTIIDNSGIPPESGKIKDGQGWKDISKFFQRKVIISLAMAWFLCTYDFFSPSNFRVKTPGIDLEMILNRNERGEYTLGTHKVVLHSVEKHYSAPAPPARFTIKGDAIFDVILEEEKPTLWVGHFILPFSGEYTAQAQWHGNIVASTNFTAIGQSNIDVKQTNDDLFVKSAWVSKGKLGLPEVQINEIKSFIWADPSRLSGTKLTPLKGPNNSIILKESTVVDDSGFYSFAELSNYEIVCWFGTNSAESIWGAFRALRPQLFPNQRPFKFHFHKVDNFGSPGFKDTRFRKCKHIFISLDEPIQPLSQAEYLKQVKTFIKHLLNAFDEERTFPALIWMLTVNESAIGTKNCHTPHLMKSSRHPCNAALVELFATSNFPKRVRLLDNTDISDVSTSLEGYTDEVSLAIALRIYVIVGKQVKVWRDAGIVGNVHGVSVNGVVKPNFDLLEYDWSQTLKGDQ